jgi:hypothetical protein
VSNYDWPDEAEEVQENEEREVPCPAHCRNGLVEVHGQETDCITCEGYGTILV